MIALAIARFEVRRRLRMISTWVYALVFAAMAVFFVLAAGGAIPGANVEFGTGGKVMVNSPYSLHVLEAIIGLFGTVIVASIAGQATFQDIDHNATALFFTAPITKRQYLAGRLAGAFTVCLVIFSAIGLGIALAVQLPVLDPGRLGPAPGLAAYVQPYLTSLLPNLFLTVSLFFTVSTLGRRMLPVYAGAVVLMIGYLIALNLAGDVERKALFSMLDPYGMLATDRVTEYWTVAERNLRRVPLTGMLLWNRLLWTGVGAAMLGLVFWRFSFTEAAAARSKKKGKTLVDVAPAPAPLVALSGAAPLDFSTGAWLSALWKLTRLQWRETVKSVIFLVIVLAGLLFIGSTAQSVGRLFDTPTWPVTYEVLELIGGTFTAFILAIITFYSGELVWRERDARVAQIQDALPTPPWLGFVSKWLALVGVLVLLLALILVSGVVIQALAGYTRFELGLYLTQLYGMRLVDFAILSTLAILVHVIVNQKYAGHFVMVTYYVVIIALPLLGFESRIYRFNSQPDWTYSDMNGFGHFVWPIVAFKLYWGSLALVMAVLANLLWVRGVETGLRHRLRLARRRLSPAVIAAGALGLAGFAGMGITLGTSLHGGGRYQTRLDRENALVHYEQTYKAELGVLPMPKVVAAEVRADLFPEERRVVLTGVFRAENKSGVPLERVVVMLNRRAEVRALELGLGETLEVEDPSVGLRVYRLPQPLAPGARLALRFELVYRGRSIENSATLLEIVDNGTFFNSQDYLPSLGYAEELELADDTKRRQHGLEPKKRTRDLDDPVGLATNYISRDADWISFAATLCTRPDQIAIAPGYLEREWTEGGRRCFAYKMDADILNFYSFMSARYAVLRDRWKDVAIEIYYHPTHTYDLDRMVRGVKASLDYFTVAFGPYQHRQVRIIEFPRYEQFAQAFPNTIPYSESIGFIARVDEDDPSAIDYPFYVTAHEVAHQWWAHQVIGGRVQGASMLSETFAQYSAFMVMKHAYGDLAMRKFLRYELDSYLRGRANERKKELPLYKVEEQNYIHYAKGSLVMYALQDAIGEDTVNRALRRFVEKTKLHGPPYTRSTEFLALLRAEAGPAAEPLIHDLFEEITLYELRVTSASAVARAGGGWDVTVAGSARKVHAGELGEETEAPLDEDLPFGALDEEGRVLVSRRARVKSGEFSVTFASEHLPAKAGVDPLSMLIDRKPDDNLAPVER